MILGLAPEAATVFLLVTVFMGIFQHSSVHTPRWLGYIIQRPESHTVHHGRGLHYYNFSDFPLFDMIFGTFRNPRDYEMEVGFYDGASARIPEMLCFRDVSEPQKNKDADPVLGTGWGRQTRRTVEVRS